MTVAWVLGLSAGAALAVAVRRMPPKRATRLAWGVAAAAGGLTGLVAWQDSGPRLLEAAWLVVALASIGTALSFAAGDPKRA